VGSFKIIFSDEPQNQKRSDMHKKFFSKARGPILIKLYINNSCMVGIEICSNKEPDPHQRGDHHKNANIL
jgi:hypothetical protein